MTVPSYTEEDVELVVRALFRDRYGEDPYTLADFPKSSPFLSQARAVLAALSSAGRLVPPGSETEWGVEITWQPAYGDGTEIRPRHSQRDALRVLDECPAVAAPLLVAGCLTHRHSVVSFCSRHRGGVVSALDPGLCDCGHYWSLHTEHGCPGWRHPDHTPRWARWLKRHRVVLLLRCKCPWEFHKLDIPAVTEEEQ